MKRIERIPTVVHYCDYCGAKIEGSCISRENKEYHDSAVSIFKESCYERAKFTNFNFRKPRFPDPKDD